MNRKARIALALTVTFSASIAGMAQLSAHDGATGVVKQRMDGFKASQQNLKAISQLMQMEEYAEIAERANKMRSWGVAIPDAFPAGSGGGVSDPRPEIWEDFAGFTLAASNHVDALDGLIGAAKAGDANAVTAAFKSVVGTCKACHMKFRKM